MTLLKQICICFLLIIFILVPVSNSIKNSFDVDKNRIFQSCGHLCSYIDLCNSGHYEENTYMQSLCSFMIEEISHLDDGSDISKIEGLYMNKFHRHDLKKHVIREKRSSKGKGSMISGITTSFFIDLVEEFRLTDIIFLLDINEPNIERNFRAIEDLSKILLGKSTFVRYLHASDVIIVANNTTQQTNNKLNVSNINNIVHSNAKNGSSTSKVEGLTTKSAFFVISETSLMENVLSYFSKMGYMNSGVMWFASCKNCSSNTTRSDSLPSTYLPNATIGIDSTFYIYSSPIIDSTGDTSIKIFEGYKLMNKWRRKEWGVWSSSYRLTITKVMIWERRGDLTGVVLRCASAGSPPMAIVEKLKGDKEGQIRITGFLADIWNGIQEVGNFSYTMVETIDGGWGSLNDDGTWTGMIGMILRDEIDIAISDFYVTAARSMVIEYSKKIVEMLNQMYIKSPGAGVGWNTFIGPFTPEMWVCTMAMILLAALVVAVTYHIGKKLNDVEDLPFTFGTTVFISFSGFFQQGTEYDPQRGATRVAMFWLLFAMTTLFAAYSAQMTAVLSVHNVVMPFENVQSMYRDTDFKVGSVKDTAFDKLFDTPNDLDQKIFKERYVKVDDTEKGIQKALDENYAFIWATESMNVIVGQACTHVAIKESVMNAIVAWPARKNWPYQKLIDYLLSKMTESGQISRIWKRWKADAKEDCFDQGASGLGLVNLFTAWLILAGLAILALCIALIEYYVWKKWGHKEEVKKADDEEQNLKDSWLSNNSSKLLKKNEPQTKSALAKEWFELAFGSN